jgi:hypothetical protein
VIGYRTPTHRDGYFYKRDYRYEEKLDVYICPNGQLLPYRTTNREGYRQYHSDPQQCIHCPVRQKCTQSSNATKVVTRHVWESSRERMDQHRLSRVGKRIYTRSAAGGHRAEHQENRPAAEQDRAQSAHFHRRCPSNRLHRSTAPISANHRLHQQSELKSLPNNKPHQKWWGSSAV